MSDLAQSSPALASSWRDWVVRSALLWINGLVLINVLLHSPFVGYDALDHLRYIDVLAEGRLPGEEDTTEFFAAPLPYALPALARAVVTERRGVVVKIAQAQNLAWSIGLTLMLVRLCQVIRPGDLTFVRWALVLLATSPIYYKMFAYVRGEPLTAFLALVVVDRALAIGRHRRVGLRDWLMLGVSLGLLLLSKQWGALVVVPVLMFVTWRVATGGDLRGEWARGALAMAMAATLVCGWFYLSLYQRFGTAAAFNSPAEARWSLTNRSAEFYSSTGVPALFRDPVRETFAVGEDIALWPVLYSDFWGDYWGYWVVHGIGPDGGWASGQALMELIEANPDAGNRKTIAPYLGRVNAVSLLPTVLVLAGIIAAIGDGWRRWRAPEPSEAPLGLELASAVVIVTAAGYFWLLVGYPGLGVKTGYVLHVVPFLALLGAAMMSRLEQFSPRAYQWLGVGLLLVGIHNAPLYVTRFVFW